MQRRSIGERRLHAGRRLSMASLWQTRVELDQGCLKIVITEFEPQPIFPAGRLAWQYQ